VLAGQQWPQIKHGEADFNLDVAALNQRSPVMKLDAPAVCFAVALSCFLGFLGVVAFMPAPIVVSSRPMPAPRTALEIAEDARNAAIQLANAANAAATKAANDQNAAAAKARRSAEPDERQIISQIVRDRNSERQKIAFQNCLTYQPELTTGQCLLSSRDAR
jgi:hypothetical protein